MPAQRPIFSASHRWLSKLLVPLLVLSLFLTQGVPSASAAVITVNPGPGAIQAAVNAATPGDVIRINAGTYAENVNLNTMNGGTTGNLTLVGVGAVTLNGAGVKLSGTSFSGHLTIDGLTFSSTDNDAINLTSFTGFTLVNSAFNTVGFDNNNGEGVDLTISSGSAPIAIYNNTFTDITNNGIAINASGTSTPAISIVGNTFTDGAGAATIDVPIAVATNTTANAKLTIFNNAINGTDASGIDIAVNNTSQLTAYIVQNTLQNLNTSAGGIQVVSNATLALTIADNTISNVLAGQGMFIQPNGAGTITGLILRNSLSSIGTAATSRGISLTASTTAAGTSRFLVSNNTVNGSGGAGIFVRSRVTAAFDATVKNNQLLNTVTSGVGSEYGFFGQISGSSPGATLKLNVIGNTVDNAKNFRLDNTGTGTFQLEGNGALTPQQNVDTNNTNTGATTSVNGTVGIIAVGTITPPTENRVPAAVDDTASVPSNAATMLDVLGNDTDLDANPRLLASFQPVSAQGGSITRNDNGTPANLSDDQVVYTPLAGFSGSDTFYYVTKDAAGASDVAKVTLTVVADTTPPDTSITSNPTLLSNSASATFAFTGSDNITPAGSLTFECKLDSGAFGVCTSPKTYSGLADGSHTFQVRAKDAAGNLDPTPVTYTWTVDATAPGAPVVVAPINGSKTANNKPLLSGTAEATSTVTVYLDGTAVVTTTADGSGNWSFTPSLALSDGSHTVKARATDAAGNVSVDSNTNTFTVDTIAPDTTITANPTNPSNSANASFSFSASEGGSTFECALDGGAFAACMSPKTYSGLADGSHTFQVRAQDAAGNVDASPASFTWTVDTLPPPAPVTLTPANGSKTSNNKPPVSGTAEANSNVTVYLDGTAVVTTTADGSGNWSFTPSVALIDGSHTAKARATDAADNVSVASNTNTFTVDTTAPDTTITASPPAATNSTSASFSFTGNDGAGVGGLTFECALNGAAFASCTSPQSYTGLADGNYTFRVRASDSLGNTDATPATFAWTVDTNAPAAPVVNSPADGSSTSAAQPPISGTAENGITVTVYIDGASVGTTVANGSGNWSLVPPTALSDGSHTVKATATDAAGNASGDSNTNTFTVDTTAPDTTITATPTNPSASMSASFTFTGNDGAGVGGLTFECALDGGAFAACTSPKTYSGLTDGSHTFQVRASDSLGNVDATPASFTWVVDTTAPDTTITANPTNPSASANASFTFTGNDGAGVGGLTFECALDGGAFAACTSPKTYSGLSDGSHTFQVRASDSLGNVDATPASFTWAVDTTAPDTTITANPTNPSASASADFSFTGNDGAGVGGLTFECALDSGAFAACTSPKTYSGLSDGSHTFQVRAVDAVGNTDATPASFTWTVDTLPPPAPVTLTPANGSNTANNKPLLSGTAEANSSVTVYLDGTAVVTTTADGSGNWSFTPSVALIDGSHTVKATATDAAGNVSVASNTNTFTVDTTAPDTTITANPTNPSASANASFTFTGNDGAGVGGLTFECALDGGAFAACTSPKTYSGLTDGSHTFQVRASDSLGNVDATPASFTWAVDTTAPDTTITANPTNPSASASADFSFTGNDGAGVGGLTFECALDGGAFAACTSPKTYSGLSDGSHTFQVRASDSLGNVDATPASFAWVVDTTAPDTTITVSPTNPSASASASFTFTGNDGAGVGGLTFECALDGGAFAACTSPKTYSGLSDGSHTFQVRSVDAVGNVDATPASFTWVVDATAPDTTITASPTNPSASMSASFTFTGNDGAGVGGLTFECALDGGAFATCTSPKTYSGLSDGSHTFQVRASDSLGNVDATPASFTWVVDTTAPDTTITANPPALTNSTTASFSFSSNETGGTFECALDGGAFAACTSPQTYTGLGDGGHAFQVRATDAAGNVDASPASFVWTIDSTPVTVTVEQASGQADPADTAPISFTVTFTKPVTGFGDSPSDVTLSGTAPGTLTATISGGPSMYTLRVSGMTGGGTVVVAVNAGAASDSAGNANAASTSADNTVTFAPTNPVATGIVRVGASPTLSVSVDFRVTFSEDVTGVDASDFALAASGLSGATITSVNGSGTTWIVSVNTGGGSGTLGLNLNDDDSIVSVRAAVPLGGAGATNGSLVGETYVLDRLAPAAALAPTAPVVRGDTAFTFTVVFSDNIAVRAADFDGSDIVVTGPSGFSQGAAFVSAAPSGDGSPLRATYRIAAPGGTWDARDNGVYTITLVANQVSDTLGNKAAGSLLGTFTVGAGSIVYMPLIFKPAEPAPLPDLVVDSIVVAEGSVEVVIRNAGAAPVTNVFWVDLYLQPRAAPTAVNQVWEALGDHGAAWAVTEGALPLAPGAQLTLRLGDQFYRADKSTLGVNLPAGAPVYVQVDSANAGVDVGAVLETHERDGGAYNNIAEVTVGTGGAKLPAVPALAVAAPSADAPRRSR